LREFGSLFPIVILNQPRRCIPVVSSIGELSSAGEIKMAGARVFAIRDLEGENFNEAMDVGGSYLSGRTDGRAGTRQRGESSL
jgi:hypothetical protein